MSIKLEAALKADRAIVYVEDECSGEEALREPGLLAALSSNIRESLEEIEILRGTVQYWESRRDAGDSEERNMILEAFRVMHGELLGLTARMKDLLVRAELASS